MKEKIKKVLKNQNRIFFLLFILELAVTFFITPNKYDDEYFLECLHGKTILSFVAPRYFNWTSRFIIEFVVCAVLKTSKYLWVLIEAFMVALAGYSISQIFIKDGNGAKQNKVMLFFMILAYPLNIMNSSGWATSTCNYMWPLATCLFALIPLKKVWYGEKERVLTYFLQILALIYACNQEQTCAILLGVYFIFSVLLIIKNKKLSPAIVIIDLLIIASLIFILTCPGNYVRKEEETVNYFKSYEMVSFIDKISLGITSTFGILYKSTSPLFSIMLLLIAVYICTSYKEKLYRVIALIPISSKIILNYGENIFKGIFPQIIDFKKLLVKEEILLTAKNCNNILNAFPLIFAFLITGCIILSLLLIFKNLKHNISLLVFLAGFCSRVIMGFSPTVFASGDRTMLFFEFSMLIVSILIWQEYSKDESRLSRRSYKITSNIIKYMGILQYINSFLIILMIK